MRLNSLVSNFKISIVLIFLLPYFAFSQPENTSFEHISSDYNLFHFSINSILQDKTGFLWFGTRAGLNLYDGKKFIVFKEISSDSSVSSDLIKTIFESKDGTLWIGTEGGFNKYNKERQTFRRYLYNSIDQFTICDNKINGVVEDKNGDIWIATSRGLSRFDRKSEKFFNYFSSKSNVRTIQSDYIWSICLDSDGNLLLGYDNLNLDYIIIPDKNGRESIPNTDLDIKHFTINHERKNSIYISKIFQDKEGTFWLGTYGLGLFSFDKSALSVKSKSIDLVIPLKFIDYQADNTGNKTISNNNITDILEDNENNLWIGTFGGGLNLLHKNKKVFEHFRYDNKNINSLNSDYIKSLYIDRSNNLWIGTYTGGINKYSPDRNKFKIYRNNPDDKNSLKNSMITSLYLDKGGILWVGTREGLNMLDREHKKSESFIYGSNELVDAPSNLIRSICEDNSNHLWIGTHNGVHCFDKKTRKYIIDYNKPLQKILAKNTIRALIYDSLNTLWIGSLRGVFKLNLSTGEFKQYANIQNDSTSLSFDYIWALYLDKYRNLWVGTKNGLNKFDIETERFKRYYTKGGNKINKQENFITTLTSDEDNVIWAGTYTGGLRKLVPSSYHISTKPNYSLSELYQFNISDKIETSIGGILVDKSQNLWVGTDNGIIIINRKRDDFRLYDIKEQAVSNELNTGAYFGGPTGEYFFGGNNGIISFFPEKIIYEFALKRSQIIT